MGCRGILPQVAPEVGHDVVVHALLHHEDLLLDDGEVIACEERERIQEVNRYFNVIIIHAI